MINRDITQLVPTLIRDTRRILSSKMERRPYGLSKTQRKKWGYLPSYKTFRNLDGTKYTVKYSGLVQRQGSGL